MSLKNQRVVDPVLTTLARGYKNSEMIAKELFPVVFLPLSGAKIPKFGKESFKIYNTERALRGKSNRINPEDLTSIDVSYKEHDLEYPVDYSEEQESIISKQKHGTHVVTKGIELRLEKEAADLASDPANYPSGHKTALTTTGCWDDYTNSNPIVAVAGAKNAIRAKIAMYPNVMILGAVTFEILQNHPKILDRLANNSDAVVTVEHLQRIFGIKKVVVGNAVYVNDAGTTNTDVWGDVAILAYVSDLADDARSEYDPSFGYTCKAKDYPEVDTYPEVGGKVNIVRSTDKFKAYIVGSDAGYLFTNTKA